MSFKHLTATEKFWTDWAGRNKIQVPGTKQ